MGAGAFGIINIGRIEMAEIIEAIKQNNLEEVNRLLAAGANPDTIVNGTAAIIEAASYNRKDIINALLEAGADINIRDKLGETPLIYAVQTGGKETVRLLIHSGANINIQDILGRTPLICVSKGIGHSEIAKLLIEAGADKNKQTREGNTALIFAGTRGHTDIIKMLLEIGEKPDIYIKNNAGLSVVDMAREGRFRQEINQLILDEDEYRQRNILNNATGFKPGSEPIGYLKRLPGNILFYNKVIGPMIGKRRPPQGGRHRKTKKRVSRRRRTHKRCA